MPGWLKIHTDEWNLKNLVILRMTTGWPSFVFLLFRRVKTLSKLFLIIISTDVYHRVCVIAPFFVWSVGQLYDRSVSHSKWSRVIIAIVLRTSICSWLNTSKTRGFKNMPYGNNHLIRRLYTGQIRYLMDVIKQTCEVKCVYNNITSIISVAPSCLFERIISTTNKSQSWIQ